MKIKESQLRQIIRESIQEISNQLQESSIPGKYMRYTTQLNNAIFNNNIQQFTQIFNSYTPEIKNMVFHYFADSNRIKPQFIQIMQQNL